MKSIKALLAVVFILVGCTPPKPPELAAGQTWSVDSRRGDGATTVTVLHLEPTSPFGPVAVVSVNNVVLKVPDKRTVNGIQPVFFTLQALKNSLTTFEVNQTRALPYESYLLRWSEVVKGDMGEKYVFSVPVKEALDMIEKGKTEPWALLSFKQP